jgi:hypothetical protein
VTDIDPGLVSFALQEATGEQFEPFAQDFTAAISAGNFVPLGGMHDGGADGLFVDRNAPGGSRFMQASISPDVPAKIRGTLTALQKSGRTVSELVYASSQRIAKLDILESQLSTELNVIIRLRDRGWFQSYVNDSTGTQAAFRTRLGAICSKAAADGVTGPRSTKAIHPSVYVYLRHQTEHLDETSSLADAVIEALLLWALEGTDPDKNVLFDRATIRNRIVDALPALDVMLSSRMDRCLEDASSKSRTQGRAIRWHRQEDAFCLPYETRRELDALNEADIALQGTVLDEWEIAAQHHDSSRPDLAKQCARVMRMVLDRLFERQGLDLAAFIKGKSGSGDAIRVREAVAESIGVAGVAGANATVVSDVAADLLRRSFYEPTAAQRTFFEKLSRTYCVLFILQSEPRIAEYFEQLTGDFRLMVGSDMLVRALAERYVPSEGQMMRNCLALLADAGASLLLSGPVVAEVVNNIRTADREFQHTFFPFENAMAEDLSELASGILVRAYIHARCSPRVAHGPPSWGHFISQFCSPAHLHDDRAFSEVRDYLARQFRMTLIASDELMDVVESKQLDELTQRIVPYKRNVELARNDALLALGVLGLRRRDKEASEVSLFGFRTWWLTAGEAGVQRQARSQLGETSTPFFVMKPEFLLNFVALAPSTAAVRRTYEKVFPSLLGIQLGRRLSGDTVQEIISELDGARDLEEGRKYAVVRAAIDHMKAAYGMGDVRSTAPDG